MHETWQEGNIFSKDVFNFWPPFQVSMGITEVIQQALGKTDLTSATATVQHSPVNRPPISLSKWLRGIHHVAKDGLSDLHLITPPFQPWVRLMIYPFSKREEYCQLWENDMAFSVHFSLEIFPYFQTSPMVMTMKQGHLALHSFEMGTCMLLSTPTAKT